MSSDNAQSYERRYNYFAHKFFIPVGVIFLLVLMLVFYAGFPPQKSWIEFWVFVIFLLGSGCALLLFRRTLTVTQGFFEEKIGLIGFPQKIIQYKVSDFSSIRITLDYLSVPQNQFGPTTKAIYIYLIPKIGRSKVDIGVYATGLGVDLKTFNSKADFAHSIKEITKLRIEYSQSIRESFGDFIKYK